MATELLDMERTPTTGESRELVLEKTQTVTKPPSMFRVMLLNDDYTPMDFVVEVLQRFFRKPHAEAVRIMVEVHLGGSGLCGVYTREVAETKSKQVMSYAKQHGHPLQCIYERE